jgi:hypothetical protein
LDKAIKKEVGKEVSIAQLLEEVRLIWSKLDGGRCEPDLSLSDIVDELCLMIGLPKQDMKLKEYVESCKIKKQRHNDDGKKIDWDDFNAIFCRAIFKFTLIKTADRLQKTKPG